MCTKYIYLTWAERHLFFLIWYKKEGIYQSLGSQSTAKPCTTYGTGEGGALRACGVRGFQRQSSPAFLAGPGFFLAPSSVPYCHFQIVHSQSRSSAWAPILGAWASAPHPHLWRGACKHRRRWEVQVGNNFCDEFCPICFYPNTCCSVPLWNSKALLCPHLCGGFRVCGNFSSFTTLFPRHWCIPNPLFIFSYIFCPTSFYGD